MKKKIEFSRAESTEIGVYDLYREFNSVGPLIPVRFFFCWTFECENWLLARQSILDLDTPKGSSAMSRDETA